MVVLVLIGVVAASPERGIQFIIASFEKAVAPIDALLFKSRKDAANANLSSSARLRAKATSLVIGAVVAAVFCLVLVILFWPKLARWWGPFFA